MNEGKQLVDPFKEAVYTLKYENGELLDVKCSTPLDWAAKKAWWTVCLYILSSPEFYRLQQKYIIIKLFLIQLYLKLFHRLNFVFSSVFLIVKIKKSVGITTVL